MSSAVRLRAGGARDEGVGRKRRRERDGCQPENRWPERGARLRRERGLKSHRASCDRGGREMLMVVGVEGVARGIPRPSLRRSKSSAPKQGAARGRSEDALSRDPIARPAQPPRSESSTESRRPSHLALSIYRAKWEVRSLGRRRDALGRGADSVRFVETLLDVVARSARGAREKVSAWSLMKSEEAIRDDARNVGIALWPVGRDAARVCLPGRVQGVN